VGAAEVRYHHVCARHGAVASASVSADVPAAATYLCPVCDSTTETWVGTSPPQVATSTSIIDVQLKRAG
jgi:hypothetical protein